MRRVVAVAGVLVLVGAGCAWARPRFDAANTGNNSAETKITAGNVNTLTRQFVVASSTSNVIPKFVVARGHVYVGGAPMRVYDSAGVAGCNSASPRVCVPQWSLDIFGHGDPDVIGPTLYSYLNDYDADGKINCSGTPTTCAQVTQEVGGQGPDGVKNPDALHLVPFDLVFQHGGGESASIYGSDAPCPAVPAPCPLQWAAALGTGATGGIIGGPAVAQKRVFGSYSPVGVAKGTLFAFDGTVGQAAPQLWSATLPGVGGTAIAVADGVVVTAAQTPSGPVLVAYDAAGNTNCSGAPKVCLPLWTSDAWTGVGTDAAPAIANGRVYRASGTQLRAYDLHGSSGCSGSPVVCQKLWVAQVGPGVTAPAVANGLVYTSATDGTVAAFDAAGVTSCSATTHVCSALWDVNVGGAAGPVEVADGRVYIGIGNGTVRVDGLP